MIAINNVLLSEEIIDEQFVCDLAKCKGACCVDGDAGAPLLKSELKTINALVPQLLPLLSTQAQEVIATQGNYVPDEEFTWVTPTINGGVCAYAIITEHGMVTCGFEQLYRNGNTTAHKHNWPKPISCHLYPIIVTKGKLNDLANYEPRPVHCAPACAQGAKLKVPVYQFLKAPIIRKYGEQFYEALHEVALYKAAQKEA